MTDNFEELTEAVTAAQTALAKSLADGDTATISKRRKALEQARQALDDFHLTRQEQEKREQAAQAEQKAANAAASWAAIRKLAGERIELAEQLRVQAASLGEIVQRMHDNRTAICAAAPVELEGAGTLTDINALSAYMKQVLELARCIPWSSPLSRWEVEQAPSLTARLQIANDQIARVESRHANR